VTAGLAAGQYLETTIPLSYGLAQAVWNPQNNRLYVSNGENGTVVVIDGGTRDRHPISGSFGTSWQIPPAHSGNSRLQIDDCRLADPDAG
jgi:hypothetical protein